MSGAETRAGRIDLLELQERLSERDRRILTHVARLRLLSARQIQLLLFPADRHSSSQSAARCCRRVLERLTRERLLTRLERRVGGARSGSASFIYALAPLGGRAIELAGARKRLLEPSEWFVAHTLAVADLLVQVEDHAGDGGIELLEWQSEPDCWREVMTLGGRVMLRPDLFLMLAVGEYEVRFFVEVDRGSEHLPALIRKCRLFNTYYRSGSEQRRHQVFPRVLWRVPNEHRADRLRQAIATDRRLTDDLFRVSAANDVLATLRGEK